MDSLNSEGGADAQGTTVVGRALVRLDTLPHRVPVDVEASLGHVLEQGMDSTADTSGEMEALIVYRDGDEVRVWLNVCPHAGRRLDWAPGKFLIGKDGSLICAAHGATFETKRGECVSGPCKGQSLRAIPVTVIDGEVRVRPDP